jgi:hypothetical protein
MKDAITCLTITEDFDHAVKFYSDILGKQINVDTYMGKSLDSFQWTKWKG